MKMKNHQRLKRIELCIKTLISFGKKTVTRRFWPGAERYTEEHEGKFCEFFKSMIYYTHIGGKKQKE